MAAPHLAEEVEESEQELPEVVERLGDGGEGREGGEDEEVHKDDMIPPSGRRALIDKTDKGYRSGGIGVA